MCSICLDRSKIIFTLHEHNCDRTNGYCLNCLTKLDKNTICQLCNKHTYSRSPIKLAIPIIPVIERRVPMLRPGYSITNYNQTCANKIRLVKRINVLDYCIDPSGRRLLSDSEEYLRLKNAYDYIYGNKDHLAIRLAGLRYIGQNNPHMYKAISRLVEEYICLHYNDIIRIEVIPAYVPKIKNTPMIHGIRDCDKQVDTREDDIIWVLKEPPILLSQKKKLDTRSEIDWLHKDDLPNLFRIY